MSFPELARGQPEEVFITLGGPARAAGQPLFPIDHADVRPWADRKNRPREWSTPNARSCVSMASVDMAATRAMVQPCARVCSMRLRIGVLSPAERGFSASLTTV
jgi:hypothetical protein